MFVIALAAMALPGCATFLDSAAVSLCRSILPAINTDNSSFDLRAVTEATGTSAGQSVVSIRYDVRSPHGPGTSRRLQCTFVRPVNGSIVTADLTGVVTEHGALSPIRLHLLKSHWLGSALAAAAEPSAVLTAGPMPDLPHTAGYALQQALAALPSIAIYALLAAAYSLIYGLIGRINLAFGELAMLAGYAAFLGFSLIGPLHILLAIGVSLALGIAACLMHGFALGRLVLVPLLRVPERHIGQHVLIASIGLSIVLSELVRLTQGTGSRWLSPLYNRPIAVARSGDFLVTLTLPAVVVALVALASAIVTVRILARSQFGRHWRAIADEPVAAALLGVDPAQVLLKTLLLSCLLTGLAGVLLTLYYGGAGYAGGLAMGLKGLIAAVLGGIGSVPGALLGGLLLGLIETVWSAAFPIEYRDAALYSILAAVLALRPQGLFGVEAVPVKRL